MHFPRRPGAVAFALAMVFQPAAVAQVLTAGASLGVVPVAAAGDVDDDGHADYVAVVGSNFEVRSGRTGAPLPQLTRTWVQGSVFHGLLGDLDADGRDDLVFESPTPPIVSTFVSGATGVQLFTAAGRTRFARDLDGDGCDDPLVGRAVISGRTQVVLRSFDDTATVTNRNPFWAGDLDGDGFEDVLVNQFAILIPQYVVHGGPSLVSTIDGNFGAASPAGDTDGDHRSEIVASGRVMALGSQQVWFDPSVVGAIGDWLDFDVDGDGRADLLAVRQSQLFLVSGATQQAFPGAGMPAIVPLGDIDRDGRDEFTTGGSTVFEIVGGPNHGISHDRGPSGTLSNGARPRLRLHGAAALGRTVAIDLYGGQQGAVAVVALGSAMSQPLAGAPGNLQMVAPVDLFFVLPGGGGHARLLQTVPPTAALVGAAATLQGVVFDAAANPLGAATSNAWDVVIGS